MLEMPEFCVTGGTGFIASYLVKALLEKGHTVRTTVRNPGDVEKVGFLTELSGAKERLQILKADLLVEGSFDEAVRGVDGVFHMASPVLIPYDENVQLWYAYAKTIAEREAWRIAKENGMDLVVVNPSFVVGPLLAPQPTSTLLLILSIVKGMKGEYPNTTVGFVHINDVVAAHLLAMEDPKASGRLICSSTVAHWSQIIEMLRAKYPSYPYENERDRGRIIETKNKFGGDEDPELASKNQSDETKSKSFQIKTQNQLIATKQENLQINAIANYKAFISLDRQRPLSFSILFVPYDFAWKKSGQPSIDLLRFHLASLPLLLVSLWHQDLDDKKPPFPATKSLVLESVLGLRFAPSRDKDKNTETRLERVVK
ncbi:Tetraketide alpha-pyrone reductase 2 [Glycine soja]